MVNTLLASFNKTDIMLVVNKLKKIYVDNRNILQYTLYGTPLIKPYPLLRIQGKLVKGPPVDESKLRYLEATPNRKRVLAVDASIKVLFNIGTMRIVEAKVAVGIWKGLREIIVKNPIKRLAVVETKEEAGEWLLRIELEAVLKNIEKLGPGDYLLLDRSLQIPSICRESTKLLIEKLEKQASARGAILVGIVKSSKLSLNTGESLIGYLIGLSEKYLKNLPWYYYPVFKANTLPEIMLGDIAVVKFSENIDNAFRVDISRKALRCIDISKILSELAFLQDTALPGYPYPLKAVHELAKISEHELNVDRVIFLELLKDYKLDRFFLDDVKSSSFREKHLWGDGI